MKNHCNITTTTVQVSKKIGNFNFTEKEIIEILQKTISDKIEESRHQTSDLPTFDEKIQFANPTIYYEDEEDDDEGLNITISVFIKEK